MRVLITVEGTLQRFDQQIKKIGTLEYNASACAIKGYEN